MISNPLPIRALLRHDHGAPSFKDHDQPVIAWDDEGHPLILAGDRLTRAEDKPGCEFRRLVWDDFGPVVGIAPTEGWVAEFDHGDDGISTLHVAGMAIRSTGEAYPIVIYPDGRCEDPQGDRAFKRIYHRSDKTARKET